MKLAFLLLLLANVAVYAWQQGAFGTLPESGREPARVARQIEPERIRVLTPPEVQQLRDKAREQASSRPLAVVPPFSLATLDLSSGQACAELGDFYGAELARVRARLEALDLGERLATRSVEVTGLSLVHLAPAKTRADADRAVADLRKQGVRDLAVITDNTPLRFGISLGAFRDADLARAHLADLEKRGVKGARLTDKATLTGTRFVIKGVDTETADKLQAVQKDFAPSKFSACTG